MGDLRKQILLVLPLLALIGIGSGAQQKEGQIWAGPTDGAATPIRWATPADFDGSLVFCRGYYTQNGTEKEIWGWYVDYPGGDNNILVRLSELTKVRIKRDPAGKPVYVVVKLSDPLLFNCPLLFLSDVGAIELSNLEIANLRLYLEKGGFIWADDFWGSKSWENWESQIRKVLPPGPYPIIDIPATHPIMNQFFGILSVPQIPTIGFWYGTGKQTSELGEDSREAHFRGIADEKGRLMVVMTHNTDIGDTWETEASDTTKEYFYKFAPIGYSLGINIFIYALTH